MTTKTRCPGSKLALTDTVPSSGDPFHHYTATCPDCDRSFYLPSYFLPIHYVTVPVEHIICPGTCEQPRCSNGICHQPNCEEAAPGWCNDSTRCDWVAPREGDLTSVPCQACGRLTFAGRICCTPAEPTLEAQELAAWMESEYTPRGIGRKLAAAIDWHRHFTERGDTIGAQGELEAAYRYAAELLKLEEAQS